MKIGLGCVPQEAGRYFVKHRSSYRWQLIVEVVGIAPFMGIENIKTLYHASDDLILGDLRSVDWSEPIELVCDYSEALKACKPEWILQIKAHIKEGNKLLAVKYLKGETGWGLKECKGVVDEVAEKKV